MASKKASKKKVVKVDFSDEESVLKAMAKELDCGVDDLSIKESHLNDFTGYTYYEVEMGRQSYIVAESNDTAEALAKAIVKQDLENEPEIFNKDFIESHIDIKALREALMSDVVDMRYEDLSDEASKRPLKFIQDNNLDCPEPTAKQMSDWAESMADDDRSKDEYLKDLEDLSPEEQWDMMGEDPEISDSQITEVAEQEAEAQLKDPMDYLRDIYGDEDASKRAIEIAGIDIDAAVEEAVSTDGAAHFIARYDGNINDGPDGIVYWREN